VGWIVGYLLLLGLLVAILSEFRHALETKGHRLVVAAAEYTIQSLFHGLLVFVLPAYYASATLTSPNVVFLALLVVLALLATFDPWFQAVVRARPWMHRVFLVLSVFAALNVALPLVGVRPFWSLVGSGGVAVLVLTPEVRRARRVGWGAALRRTLAGAVVAATVAAVARVWIPPAPLSLARAAVAADLVDWQPVEPLEGTISSAALRERGSLVAYTAVYAPSGLHQPIAHVWRHDGDVVTVVPLSPIRGGRREGFRTYSRKTGFPANPAGRWTVDVVTSGGQLIGRVRFTVTP
jgi:hypothetical protein